jgi:hypothetical protein
MRGTVLRRGFLAVAPLVAAAGLGGCIQTSTYGTGEMPEMAIFREVTGGFGRPKAPPIQYQPRAPLVMPPSDDQLPQPVEAASATDGVAWPEDPDQTERARKEYGDETPADDISPEEARRLRPLAGLMPEQERPKTWKDNENPVYDIVDKKKRDQFKAAVDEAEGIPKERRYLTDPPDTLREPAATAPTEFEDIKRERGGFLTRLFLGGL